jgi:catechol-2,3-dioxygenase
MAASAEAPHCSVVLAADDAAALAAFYGALLQQFPEAGLSQRHWRLPLPSGGLLELDAPSASRPRPRQTGRLALCLRRAGEASLLEDWIAAAIRHGATLQEGPRAESFGWEAWLADPEGNGLLLLVTPASADAP